MARWEPNARERLVVAAIDLFAEQGYDGTAVAQIAERAGLTKTTFFRHFPDKREVLFAGQAVHGRLLAEGIAGAPDGADPLAAVAAGLDRATDSFTPEQREFGPRLRAVVESNAELRERAVFKQASLVEAMSGALRGRGVPERVAAVAAELGGRAFHSAYARWCEPAERRSFGELARRELDELRTAAAELGAAD
ncbi:TetR/AcrR family transcriptional regulator [Phaeacidiphilus oryzae]|uniref:TetR/AcrR family transcriptional regulator n=1 Tax=Phaeacidiphilus oryzae TaxID=348818 RepID=UPI000562D0D0|nr:TetR/AcrR family transcriptional regulator [Phaeacidiphilus oryzae]